MGWSAVIIYHRFVPLTTQFISIKCLTVDPIMAASWSSSVTRYRCLRWILDNVVHSYELSFLQDWWRGNTTIYNCLPQHPQICRYFQYYAIGNVEVHVHAQFLVVFLFYLGHSYIYIHIHMHIHIHIHIQGIWQSWCKNGGNFENGIPIPHYQIHLVRDQIPYDLKTKSNIQEGMWEWSWKRAAIVKTFECFYSSYHIKAPF